jgi:pimeloyl-ACP methyl ester carboxylesterase
VGTGERAFRRPDLVAGLILVDPGHEDMESGLPLAFRWGWRIVRAVHPDELHGDVTAADAALSVDVELVAFRVPHPDRVVVEPFF